MLVIIYYSDLNFHEYKKMISSQFYFFKKRFDKKNKNEQNDILLNY